MRMFVFLGYSAGLLLMLSCSGQPRGAVPGANEQSIEKGCLIIRALLEPRDPSEQFGSRDSTDCHGESLRSQIVGESRAKQAGFLTIRLRLEPSKKCSSEDYFHESDVLLGFGRSQTDRQDAIRDAAFRLQSRLWILVGGERVTPQLCHLEQNFGLDNGRTFWAKFRLSLKQAKMLGRDSDLTLVFDPPVPGARLGKLQWTGKSVHAAL